jgi:magnesium chelatase family protein
MAIARVSAAQPSVLSGDIVTVEADLTRGLHSYSIVGLAGKAVEEARDRVSAAIKNSGFPSPKSRNHKITISLAPADLKKEGPLFDLPISIAYLLAAGEIKANLDKKILVGELSLDGTLRPVTGILPVVKAAAEKGYDEVIVPVQNAEEAALIPNITVIPAHTLSDVVLHLDHSKDEHTIIAPQPQTTISQTPADGRLRLEDVRGQETAKRGLLIAAAGRHNVIMVGPPGTGKTMLARVFESILPPLSVEDALAVTSIHSVAGTLGKAISARPPFRSPHHTASHTSLVGGGTYPKPGEVTLAHKGVLFLITVLQTTPLAIGTFNTMSVFGSAK